MRFCVVVVLLALNIIGTVYGQDVSVADMCSSSKLNFHVSAAKTTVLSPLEELYDVKTVHLDIELDNQSVAIKGKATTVAQVLEDNFALYVCELNEKLNIDSVFINNQKASFTREGNQVNILTPTILQSGERFTAVVYYQGSPDPGTVFFFQSGLNNAPAVQWGSKVTYTLSEPYNSKDWWPCKQSLQDKVDSTKIWVTVPDTLMAGSNGVLRNIKNTGNGRDRYEWETNYPMAYYLLSVSVANYRDYSFAKQMPDGKVVRVQNFIYDRPGILDTFKNRIDTTADMLYYFSELFGTYPFYKEKYGHCMAPVFGGMEHQTMTTLHNFNAPLVAHELGHQWFGDYVTCATWKDIWLNEGVASYIEYLYAEKFWGEEGAQNYMQKVHNAVLDDTILTGSVYVPASDTINPYRIFDGRLSYQKGSAVLHMLRYLVNDDALFFEIFKQQQIRFANGNITTEQFQKLAEDVTGMNLQQFFEQWIYGEGYPVYTVDWNQLGSKLIVHIKQHTVVPESVPFYHMPVELNIQTETGNRTVRVENNSAEQTYTFTIDEKVSNLVFDADNHILNKERVTHNASLGVDISLENDVYVYPNPTHDVWNVINVENGVEAVLTDLTGTVLWNERIQTGNRLTIAGENYPAGMYILYITNGDKKLTSKKLIKL